MQTDSKPANEETGRNPVGFVALPKDDNEPEKNRPEGRALGPKGAKMATKTLFKTAQKIGGKNWKPDDEVKEMIEESADHTIGSVRVPWLLVLIAGLMIWVAVSITAGRKKEDDAKAENRDYRGVGKREEPVSQEPRRCLTAFYTTSNRFQQS